MIDKWYIQYLFDRCVSIDLKKKKMIATFSLKEVS